MIYLYLAQGFEEVEALATLDVIRRAKIDIASVGVGGKFITGSHNITVKCDIDDEEATFSGLEGIILPGGMPGTINLLESDRVNRAIDYCNPTGKLISAICAAPMILGKKGLLNGKEAICFPGFEKDLAGATISDKYVCTDGNIITARGMGSAVQFGLAIVSYFKGEAFAAELQNTLQIYR